MKRRRRFSSESGQSLVELALITPVLLLMLVGFAEMGRYTYLSVLVGNAAEAGAAYGAQSLGNSVDAAGIRTAAQNDFQDGHGLSGLTVTPSTSCGCDSSGTTTTAACTGSTAGTCGTGHWVVNVQVTASGTFTSMFNYPGVPASLTIVRTVIMRVKQT